MLNINETKMWEQAYQSALEKPEQTEEEKEKERREKEERYERNKKETELRQQMNEAMNREANAQLQSDIECMNKYKQNGKFVLPQQFKDLPDNQIYFYHGHGSTVCDDYGFPIKKIVPDNCIYITQTVCGIVNTLKRSIIEAFLDESYAHVWRDPVGNLNELKKIFTLDNRLNVEGLHVHMPGCSYIETSYTPLGYHDLKENYNIDQHRLEFSGIMSLEAAHTVPKDNPYIEGIDFPHTDLVDLDIVKNSFDYTFYPGLEMSEEEVPLSSITDTIYLFPIEDTKVKIDDVILQASKVSDYVKVSDIMSYYPGIHFNFLCRSFGKEDGKCGRITKRALTRRRRHSAVVQNTVYNTFRKLTTMGLYFPKKRKRVANDDSILDYVQAVSDKLPENLQKFFELYEEVRIDEDLPKTRELIKTLFSNAYLNEFNLLLEDLSKAREEKNKKSEEDTKEKIGNLIRLLKITPKEGFQTKYYAFELGILSMIAWAAAMENDEELFDYVCSLGVLNDFKELLKDADDDIKEKWLNRCDRVFESTSGGYRKRKGRKTFKKKRT